MPGTPVSSSMMPGSNVTVKVCGMFTEVTLVKEFGGDDISAMPWPADLTPRDTVPDVDAVAVTSYCVSDSTENPVTAESAVPAVTKSV